MRIYTPHPILRTLTVSALALAAVASPPAKMPTPVLPQRPVMPRGNPTALAAIPNLASRAELLAPGKTQGTFRLNGVVHADKTVILRWANDRGEMPTEGVIVSRQRVGETTWKELNARKPVAFFRTDGVESRLKKLPPEKREELTSMIYSDMPRDPGTGRRMALPATPPKGAPAQFSDISLKKVPDQFRAMRSAGRLSVADLQMLNSRADLDSDAADLYGLTYKDQPPSGVWRYKITVRLPEGGSVEVNCDKTFDPSQPTVVPPPPSLTAGSSNGAVLLNWKAPEGDIVAGYNVYRSTDPKGTYRRLNQAPVKLVEITAEDPELTARRAAARSVVIGREVQKLAPELQTPARLAEIRALATDSVAAAGSLPALPPAQSKAIRTAVAEGRLQGAGPVKTLSVYTDSIRDEGNTDLVNEHLYYYKVVSVDIAGGEGNLATAVPVAGIPKDLQPPTVPGRPGLVGAVEPGNRLRDAQNARLRDPRLMELNQAVAAKTPGAAFRPQAAAVQAKPGIGLQPQAASLAIRPEIAALSLTDARRLKLSRAAATMPVKEMAALAESSVLRSLPDGSAPPAELVWAGSPEDDLKLYTVYRASGKGPLAKIATTTTPSWQDTTLEVGKAYTYAVTATDQLGNESAQSAGFVLQVCDSALPGRLALKGVQGKISTGVAPAGASHRFLRPAGRFMATTGLDRMRMVKPTGKLTATASAPMVGSFSEAKAGSVRAPSVTAARLQGMAPARKAAEIGSVKGLEVAAADPGALKATTHLKAVRALPLRSFNPMLALAVTPNEIHVKLTWDKPLEGYPLEYSVFQAPQDVRVVSTPRKPVRSLTATLGTATLVGTSRSVAAPQAIKPTGVAPVVLQPRTSALASVTSAQGSQSAQAANMIHTTPEAHAVANRLTLPAGAVLAEARKDFMADVQIQTGPGKVSLITTTPVKEESFVVTFPAEAFYFQIQAHTREFGRVVDGPVSEMLEVRLPDIVAPPIPDPGTLDLHEGAGGFIDATVTWTQAAAPDLAGEFVERQPMAYKIVDGIAQATTALGPAKRLNETPLAGLVFKDPAVPGGFYRYTIRSVDKTGNASQTRGVLDVLVPGEPVPDAPQGIVLSGDHLSWQAVANAGGYTVWRSFTGVEGDFDCISPVLGATATSYDLPPQKKVYLRVVARSASGMYQTPSEPVIHP